MGDEMHNRAAVLAAVTASVRDALAGVEAIRAATVDEATGEASKQENKYDTRSLEASYLAAGQAERVVALRRLLAFLLREDVASPRTRGGLGALVGTVEGEGSVAWWFVTPEGGGMSCDVDGALVRLVTPASPLGRALLGVEQDDDVVLRHPRARTLQVMLVT